MLTYRFRMLALAVVAALVIAVAGSLTAGTGSASAAPVALPTLTENPESSGGSSWCVTTRSTERVWLRWVYEYNPPFPPRLVGSLVQVYVIEHYRPGHPVVCFGYEIVDSYRMTIFY